MGILFWRIMISFFLPFVTSVIGHPVNQTSSNLTHSTNEDNDLESSHSPIPITSVAPKLKPASLVQTPPLDSFSLNNTSNATIDFMSLDLNDGNSSENETNSSEITPPTTESNDDQIQDSDTQLDDKDADSSDDKDHSKGDDSKPIIVRLMFLAEVSRASDENPSNSTITKIQPIISIDAKSSVANDDQPYFAPSYDKENDLISVLKAPSDIVTDDWPTIKYQPIITSTIENITIPMENKTITSPERLTLVNSSIKRSVTPNPAFRNPIKDMLSRLSSPAQPNGSLLPPGATQQESSFKVNVSGHSVNSADPAPDLDSLRTILALSSQRRQAANSIPNNVNNQGSNIGFNRQSLPASPPMVFRSNTSTIDRSSSDTVSGPGPSTNVRHTNTTNTLRPVDLLDTILALDRNDRFAAGSLPRRQANGMTPTRNRTVLRLDTTTINVTGDVNHNISSQQNGQSNNRQESVHPVEHDYTIRMNPNRQQERILRIPGGDNRRRDSSTTVSGTTSTQSLSQRFRAHINSRYSTKVENADTAHAVDRTLFVNSNQEMVPTRSDQSYNAEIMPQVQDIAQKQSQYPQLRSPANRDLAPAQQSTSYKQIDNNQGVASTRDMQQFRPVLMADPVRSKPLEVNSSSSKTWNPFRNMRYDSTLHNTTEFSGVEDIFRLYGNQIPRTGQPQSLPGPTNSNLEQVSQIQTGQSHIQQTTSRHHQQNHNPFTSYHQSSMGNPPLLQTSLSPSILENRQGTPRVESPIHREQNPDLNNMDDYKGSHTNPNNQRTSQQMISEPYGQQLGSIQPNTEALSRYQDIANSYPVVTRQTLDIQHGVQSGSNQRHQEVSPTYVSAAPATETNRHTVRGAFQTQSRPAYTQQIRNTFRNGDLNTPLQTSRNQNGNQHRSMGISQVRPPSHNHTYSQQVRIIPSRQEYNPPMDTVSSTQEGISMPSMPDIQSYRHQVRSMGNYYRLPGMDHGVDSSRNPSRDVNLEAPAEYKQQVRLHSSRHDVIPQAQLSGAYMQEIRGASPRNSGNLFISSGQPRALHVNGHYSGNPETQSNPRGSSGSFQSETIVTNTPYNRYYPPNQFSNRESIPTINTENNPANAHTMVASLYNSRGRSSNYTDNIATENTASTQFNNEHNLQAVGRHNGLQSPSAPGRPVLQPSQWDTNGSSLETVHVPVSNQNSPPPNNLPNSAHELPGTTSVSQNISLLELISRIVEATLEPTTSSPVRSALEPNLPHIQNPNTTLDSQAFETFPNDMWNHRGQPSRQFLKFITSHPDYNSLISDVANAASDSSIQHSQPVLNDTNLANTNILGPSAAGQFSDPSLSIQRSVLRDSPDSHGSVPHSNLTQNTASDQSVNLTEVRVNMLKNIRRALAVTTGSRHPLSAMPVLQNRTADDLVVMAVDSIMRMEALRSLDCRSISYMYNVNFMDYMPIACDNSCPPISKCVNVGSIGFCCPLYVTQQMIRYRIVANSADGLS